MPRIPTPPSIDTAPEGSRPLLEAVKERLGVVPNMFRLMANSPAALEGFLGLVSGLDKGALDKMTQDRIAVAVAQLNGCTYCLSANTYLARNFSKLDDAEIAANRRGTSNDVKAAAAVRFAVKLARKRGKVSEADIRGLKDAGYDDGEILEIIGHVALQTFTNLVNEALATAIDFPLVRPA